MSEDIYCTRCGTLLGEGDYIEIEMCDECFDNQLFAVYGDEYDPDTG